ncbi:MAG: hypothetical protein ISEC1_P1484 [Thiomicrorhabdus sp.]|nr:MAG: hypothetical protein ISEC1_P1484 [Thiomicrorhabdus sp.]
MTDPKHAEIELLPQKPTQISLLSPAYLFWKIQCVLLKLANRLRHKK